MVASLIDWVSDTLSQGYTNLQSLAKCLEHRSIASDTVCSQARLCQAAQCIETVASLTPCANLCHFVCFAGSTFKAEDLSSLQIGDMKTKMLLGALTKLGKLRVQVDNGQIVGYRMDL